MGPSSTILGLQASAPTHMIFHAHAIENELRDRMEQLHRLISRIETNL